MLITRYNIRLCFTESNHIFRIMTTTEKGILLIANPFLKDANFLRTVVLICNHEEQGTFGLTLNKRLPLTLAEILPEVTNSSLPVYLGGPVQPDTLHFLHQYPDLIGDGIEVGNNVFCGGNFESLKVLLAGNRLDPDKVKFFLGYSGWSEGQLDTELQEDSWLTVASSQRLIFQVEPEDIWKESLKEKGGQYELLINYPLDPQLN